MSKIKNKLIKTLGTLVLSAAGIFNLGEEYSLPYVSSSGNWKSHIPLIKAKRDSKIILIGFSAGTQEICSLARECKKQGIGIRLMAYLDPTHKNKISLGRLTKIPGNVKEVSVFIGESSGIYGGSRLTNLDFESPKTKYANRIIQNAGHLGLPYSL